MIPVKEQPSEGFVGPGKAFNWLKQEGQHDQLGIKLFIVREDGVRPKIQRVQERGARV